MSCRLTNSYLLERTAVVSVDCAWVQFTHYCSIPSSLWQFTMNNAHSDWPTHLVGCLHLWHLTTWHAPEKRPLLALSSFRMKYLMILLQVTSVLMFGLLLLTVWKSFSSRWLNYCQIRTFSLFFPSLLDFGFDITVKLNFYCWFYSISHGFFAKLWKEQMVSKFQKFSQFTCSTLAIPQLY